MRSAATASQQDIPSTGITGRQWFAEATIHINLIKDVETKLSADLNGLAGSLKADADRSLMVSAAITIVAMAISVALAVLLIIALQTRASGLLQRLTAVAQKDVARLETSILALENGDLTQVAETSTENIDSPGSDEMGKPPRP